MEMERGLVKTSAGYMHYRATGQGKPIILMHANQRSSVLYLELMEVLGKGLRVLAIDHPSHGMSDHIAGQPTMAEYARYVTEVMDRINVAQIEAGRERWQALNALADYDMPANLERLQCPVLLIWGEHFLYLKFREEFTRRIKHHQALVVQGGRFCLLWEHPDAVGQATLDFVA